MSFGAAPGRLAASFSGSQLAVLKSEREWRGQSAQAGAL